MVALGAMPTTPVLLSNPAMMALTWLP